MRMAWQTVPPAGGAPLDPLLSLATAFPIVNDSGESLKWQKGGASPVILTGPEIVSSTKSGKIVITPFNEDQVNPNSYNVCLGDTFITYTDDVIDAYWPNRTEVNKMDSGGMVLQPGELYLGHTIEEVGSDYFVPLLFGRSSVGRLGLFVEITAPIGDIGFHGQWTLMLSPIRPLRVYPGMKIGQIMFFESCGEIETYSGKYQGSVGPQESRYWRDKLVQQ